MNSIEVVNTVVIRKLSDGEELVIVGPVSIPKAAGSPRDPGLERRREALAETGRHVAAGQPRPQR